jgi:hypothetical protein
MGIEFGRWAADGDGDGDRRPAYEDVAEADLLGMPDDDVASRPSRIGPAARESAEEYWRRVAADAPPVRGSIPADADEVPAELAGDSREVEDTPNPDEYPAVALSAPTDPSNLMGSIFSGGDHAERRPLHGRGIEAGRDVYEAGRDVRIYPVPAPQPPQEGHGPVIRLPSRPPSLAGREGLLRELRISLAGGAAQPRPRVTVLCGMGGIGKTSVAVEYAYRRLDDDLNPVWFLPADNPAALTAGFTDLAARLGGGGRRAGRDAVAAAHAALAARTGGWLLIFDNALDPGDLEGKLPPGGDGEVIVTSQDPFWPGRLVVELPVLEREDAVRFLLGFTGDPDPDAAGELADELGCLPLALAQAAGYINAAGRSLREYLALYRDRGAELRARGRAAGYDKVIATTWRLALDEISRTTPRAVGLLRLLACFAPDDIPVRLLLRSGARPPGILPVPVAADIAALADEVTIDEAISALREFCLITPPSRGGAVSVHRLVQAVTLDALQPRAVEGWRKAAEFLVSTALPADPRDRGSWPTFAALLLHAQAVLPPASQAAEHIAQYLGHSGGAAAARDLLREVAAAREGELGASDPDTLRTRGHLAYWTGRAGDPAAARDQFADLLPDLSRVLGADHEHTLIARSNLGRWTLRCDDPAAARDQFAGLVADLSRIWGPCHPDALTARACLATATGRTGDAAGACAQYTALLADLSQAHPDDRSHAPLFRQKLNWWAEAPAREP